MGDFTIFGKLTVFGLLTVFDHAFFLAVKVDYATPVISKNVVFKNNEHLQEKVRSRHRNKNKNCF